MILCDVVQNNSLHGAKSGPLNKVIIMIRTVNVLILNFVKYNNMKGKKLVVFFHFKSDFHKPFTLRNILKV